MNHFQLNFFISQQFLYEKNNLVPQKIMLVFDSFLSFGYYCICSYCSKNIFHILSFWKRMKILRPKNHNLDAKSHMYSDHTAVHPIGPCTEVINWHMTREFRVAYLLTGAIWLT